MRSLACTLIPHVFPDSHPCTHDPNVHTDTHTHVSPQLCPCFPLLAPPPVHTHWEPTRDRGSCRLGRSWGDGHYQSVPRGPHASLLAGELMGCGPAHPGQLSMRRPLQSQGQRGAIPPLRVSDRAESAPSDPGGPSDLMSQVELCISHQPVALSFWKRQPQAGEAPNLGTPCLDPASPHHRPHRRPLVLRSSSS